MTADVVIAAAYGSAVEEDGMLFAGFAEGEDEGEPYILFRQALDGGPVWVELGDEALGAWDAVEMAVLGPDALRLTLAAAALPRLGYARTVEVRISPQTEDAGPALDALAAMLGPRLRHAD
jgi:hypothetical protein